MPTFQAHKHDDSPIYDFAVRILAVDKSKSRVIASGTGVVIASHLILTAKHVIEDFFDKLGNGTSQKLVDDFSIWVVFISSEPGQVYNVYENATLVKSVHSDLALLHLYPNDLVGNGHIWKQVSLSLSLPAIGETITAFGFTKSKVELNFDRNGTTHIHILDEPVISTSEIIEVFPTKRDDHFISFPSFRINGRIDGGMSGGPVFGKSGKLVGISCSGFDLDDDSEDHLSYITLLWPLMACPIEQDGKLIPLYDLAIKEIISTNGLEHIEVSNSSYAGIYDAKLLIK